MTETRQRSFIPKFLIVSLVMHGVIVAGIIYGASIAPPLLIQGDPIMVNLVDLGVEAGDSTQEVKGDKFHPEKRSISHPLSRKDTPKGETTISVKKSVPAVHQALNKARPVAVPGLKASGKEGNIQKPQYPTPEPHPLRGMEVTRSDPSAVSRLEPFARVDASGGSSAGTSDPNAPGHEVQEYLDDIRKQIEEAKHYPWLARLKGVEGTVKVGFRIDSGGFVHNIYVADSSKYKILDKTAILIVKKATRFPPPPMDSGIDLVIPMQFRLDRD